MHSIFFGSKRILVFTALLLMPYLSYAQNDWQRWSKADISYEHERLGEQSYFISSRSVNSFLLTSLKATYSFFISDLDGDNCPFHPTCSTFFIRSVQETNFFKGSLMFADRFTRDTNIFKRIPYYPLHKSGRLYDPVHNYTLRINDIKYYPRDIIVD